MDGKKLLIPTLIVGLITVVLLAVVHAKGGNSVAAAYEGLTSLAKVLPVLAFALIAASCLVYLVPEEVVVKWLGKESGAKGIFVASVAGGEPTTFAGTVAHIVELAEKPSKLDDSKRQQQ